MRVFEVMTHAVECIGSEATLRDAAAKMKALNIGVLPVCDNDRLVGMITDRDITIRATAIGNTPRVRVRDIMTPTIISCYADELVVNAALMMQQNQVRRLIVLDHDERLVGIISLGDLAVETHDEQLAGNTLEAVSSHAEDQPSVW